MRTCLILGGGRDVYSDHKAALALGDFAGAVIVNLVGRAWPQPLDAWVSLHGDKLKRPWRAGREMRGLPPHRRLLSMDDCDHRFPGQDLPGSSGLFAVKVALDELSFDRAVLCGVPLTLTPHFDDFEPWRYAENYHAGWRQALPHIADRVRSVGGWTETLLGRPDAAWINGD